MKRLNILFVRAYCRWTGDSSKTNDYNGIGGVR